MKIVLTIEEVIEIVAQHLASNGKLEYKPTDVHWCIDNTSTEKSYVEFEQQESDFNTQSMGTIPPQKG